MKDWKSFDFGRRNALIAALDHLLARGPLTKDLGYQIVEIGTSSGYSPDGLGNAILAFAPFVAQHGGKVHSFDPDEPTIEFSRLLLRARDIPADAVSFVAGSADLIPELCPGPIDLLYVDGPDGSHGDVTGVNDENNTWYVRLYEKIQPLLQLGSLMLWDDTLLDPVGGWHGKGGALVPKLLGSDWRELPVNHSGCVLLERA